MRGMDRLVQLRREGLRPEVLWLVAHGLGGRVAFEGDVLLDPEDHPSTADLRALHGLTVVVLGNGYGGFDEAEAWARAACAARATHVGLAIVTTPYGDRDGPAWIRHNGEDIA